MYHLKCTRKYFLPFFIIPWLYQYHFNYFRKHSQTSIFIAADDHKFIELTNEREI